VSFEERGGMVDATEVRAFLAHVASALEVLQSGDAQQALRAEFARNAEIAQQVLDAGQNASEQLRRQAAADARRILEETRDATMSLRETVELEIDQSRDQVVAMRGQFIQDLRDLYDRIGASLYRFERAAEESHVEPIAAPERRAFEAQSEPVLEAAPEPLQDPEPMYVAEPVQDEQQIPAQEIGLHEGAQAPAWTQLPAEAWSSTEGAALDAPTPSNVEDPFHVIEDEPLAPGEPLIDLREFATEIPPEHPAGAHVEPEMGEGDLERSEDALGGSWLEPAEPAVLATPEDLADLGGSWLGATEAAPEPAPAAAAEDGAEEHPGDTSREDALAEAIIAGTPFPDAAPAEDEHAATATPQLPSLSPVPVPSPAPAAAPDASPDALATRQLVLDALAAGQTRETIEAYLRDQLGMFDPGAFVDAALNTAPGHPPA